MQYPKYHISNEKLLNSFIYLQSIFVYISLKGTVGTVGSFIIFDGLWICKASKNIKSIFFICLAQDLRIKKSLENNELFHFQQIFCDNKL